MYASGADFASPRTDFSEAITVIFCPSARAGIFLSSEALQGVQDGYTRHYAEARSPATHSESVDSFGRSQSGGVGEAVSGLSIFAQNFSRAARS
jgi:hypothetical protein